MDDADLEKLMRAGLAGDAGAHHRLLVSLTPVLRRLAWAALPQDAHHLAEDVVQETLLVIHLKRASWDRNRPLMAWVRVILRHKAIDALRRRRGGHEPVEDLADSLPDPATPDPLAGHMLEQMLSRLTTRDAALIRAHALLGRDEAEIQKNFGLSAGAMRVALHRALNRLKAMAQKDETE